MASIIKVTAHKEKIPENEGSESPPDNPLLDLSDAAVKELIRTAKKRGYVTHDQINALLASEEVNSEQIETILAKFSEMGINWSRLKRLSLRKRLRPVRRRRKSKARTSQSKSSSAGLRPNPVPKKPPSELSTPCACTSAT